MMLRRWLSVPINKQSFTFSEERCKQFLSGLSHVLLWIVDEVFINELLDFGLGRDGPSFH
jgi:hypothetical protein